MIRTSRALLSVAILALLAWWVLSLDAFNPESWQGLLSRDMVLPCGAFLGLSVAAYVLRGVRWAYFLDQTHARNWSGYVTAYGTSFALGAITPARSGDLLRIGLTQRLGHSVVEVTGAYVVERISDLLLLLLALSTGLLLFPVEIHPAFETSAWVMALTLLIAYLLFFAFAVQAKTTRVWPWIAERKALSSIVGQLRTGLSALSSFKGQFRVAGLGIVIWLLHIAATTLFLGLVMPDLPITAGILFLTLTNLSGLLQISPGNLGPYEVIGMLVLEQHGVPTADALAVTAGLHAFALLSLSCYGGLCYLVQSLGKHSTAAHPEEPNG